MCILFQCPHSCSAHTLTMHFFPLNAWTLVVRFSSNVRTSLTNALLCTPSLCFVFSLVHYYTHHCSPTSSHSFCGHTFNPLQCAISYCTHALLPLCAFFILFFYFRSFYMALNGFLMFFCTIFNSLLL